MHSSAILRHWRAIVIVIAIWSAYGLFSAWITHYRFSFSSKPMSWGESLADECAYAYIVAVLTPAVVVLARHFRLERLHLVRNAVVHLIAMVSFSVSAMLAWILLFQQGGVQGTTVNTRILLQNLSHGLENGAPLYWLIVGFCYVVEYYRRYQVTLVRASDLNAQLAHAQLQALKMKLNPHFLFNTLHAISELVHDDPAGAERMILGLSQLLRLSLDTSADLEVPLQQELRFVRLYLDIEKTRFEERLQIEFDVDQALLEARVPNLILQPLVENAIKHGISKQAWGGVVVLSAKQDGASMILVVRDNGGGVKADTGFVHEGIGLSTTRARLEKLYGPSQSFYFVRRPGAGAEATIRLPLKLTGTEVHRGSEEVARTDR